MDARPATGRDRPAAPASPGLARSKLALAVVLGLGLPALYLFAHPYEGIRHDAHYYALQALRRLEPAALGGDLYFRFGSQDRYTLFSPLYAALIRPLGLEPAAMALSRLMGLSLLAAAWLLARRLMEKDLSPLAVALFALVPGSYGRAGMFTYGEDFATPRPLAEALTLAGVAFLLGRRRALAAGLLAAAFVVHPLMAAPGAVLAAGLLVPVRRWPLLGLLGALGCGACLLVARFAPVGPVSLLDAQWRAVLEWVPRYLLTYTWRFADWQHLAVPSLTLALAAAVLPQGPLRHLALAALAVGVVGALLAVLGSHSGLVLLLQGQAWRWAWLSRALAVLLLLPLAGALWSRGPPGQAALAWLTLGWVAGAHVLALPAALLALPLALRGPKAPKASTLARALSWGVAALAALAIWSDGEARAWALAVPAAALAWHVAFRGRARLAQAAAVLGVVAAFAVQAARAAPDTASGYSQQRFDALKPWRDRIGPDQTVLVMREPFVPWLLLHRRSYTSALPVVFSRDSALAAHERHRRLEEIGAGGAWFVDASGHYREPLLTLPALRRLCQEREAGRPAVDFVVAEEVLPVPSLESPVSLPSLSGESPRPAPMRLYACADVNALP